MTRNHYGAEILNIADIMVIDIDFSTSKLSYQSPYKKISFWDNILFFFGLNREQYTKKIQSNKAVNTEIETLKTSYNLKKDSHVNVFYHLFHLFVQYPHLSFLIYRTHSGIRLIESTQLWNPKDKTTQHVLNQFGCDKAYMALCVKQNCFRARLTPKPYRLAIESLHLLYPYESREEYTRVENWIQMYNETIKDKSVTQYYGSSDNLKDMTYSVLIILVKSIQLDVSHLSASPTPHGVSTDLISSQTNEYFLNIP